MEGNIYETLHNKLLMVDNSYPQFIESILTVFSNDEEKMIKLIEYIESESVLTPGKILAYAKQELDYMTCSFEVTILNDSDEYQRANSYVVSQRKKLIKLLKKYDMWIYTNKCEKYEYLPDNGMLIEVINPYWGHNLFIELTSVFRLMYLPFEKKYRPDKRGMESMIQDINDIIYEKKGVLQLKEHDEVLGCILIPDELPWYADGYEVLKHYCTDENLIRLAARNGGTMEFLAWTPCSTFEMEIRTDKTRE